MMKMKVTETKFRPMGSLRVRLLTTAACLGAFILICSTASAQNLFVSGRTPVNNCVGACGVIYKFNWDGGQSIFATGLTNPWDLAFDTAGNLFVVDYSHSGLLGDAVIYKITPTGVRTVFASGLSYPSYLAVDGAGNVFVADYNHGIIYRYKPVGSRSVFASGLFHPVGMVFNRSGDLFVADNNAGNIYQGHIYQYKANGSRAIIATLDPADRPADLAFDSVGNLLVADLGGNVYRYGLVPPLRPHNRTTFGSVPSSAQSLGFDSAGNLLVVDGGPLDSIGPAAGNAIYKFTQQGLRSGFANGRALNESFACLAFRPMACCQ